MTGEGLEKKRWSDTIEDFVQLHGHEAPRWAVGLTYEIGLDVLVRKVLPPLSRRGRTFRTVVLADQGALEKSLGSAAQGTGRLAEGAGVLNLHPVRCKGRAIFHPKLLLLRAGGHVRACFGSANLTAGGLGGNLELWDWTEAPAKVGALVHFLHQLRTGKEVTLDGAARRNLARALLGLAANPHPSVWSSLQEPFGRRLKRGPEWRSTRTWVLSPLYATEGGLLKARRALPATPLLLYTDESTRLDGAKVHVYKPPAEIAGSGEEGESLPSGHAPARLHAKAYVFETPTGVHAWVGSANFTTQALTRTAAAAGNVEILVRSAIPASDWRALKSDLARNFEFSGKARPAIALEEEPRQLAVGAVFSGELQGVPGAYRLVLLVRPGAKAVVIRSVGAPVRVAAHRGRAELSGRQLERLIGGGDLGVSQVIVLQQQVLRGWVPFVVNVPHVPDQLSGTQHSVDVLLDDLLGRVPRPALSRGPDGDEEEPPGEGQAEEQVVEEFARPLDEVRSQGELDQLAVKAALLRRLVTDRSKVGLDRHALEQEALRALEASSAPEHRRTIRRIFLGRKA